MHVLEARFGDVVANVYIIFKFIRGTVCGLCARLLVLVETDRFSFGDLGSYDGSPRSDIDMGKGIIKNVPSKKINIRKQSDNTLFSSIK